jgi:hypothetical protein
MPAGHREHSYTAPDHFRQSFHLGRLVVFDVVFLRLAGLARTKKKGFRNQPEALAIMEPTRRIELLTY